MVTAGAITDGPGARETTENGSGKGVPPTHRAPREGGVFPLELAGPTLFGRAGGLRCGT